MREPVYEVFARKTREEALRHIGYVNAPDSDLARVFAWKTYDEQNWFEMCIIPRAAILPVNRPEPPLGPRMPNAAELVHTVAAGSYGGSEIAEEAKP